MHGIMLREGTPEDFGPATEPLNRVVSFSHLRVVPGCGAITDMTGTLRDYLKGNASPGNGISTDAV